MENPSGSSRSTANNQVDLALFRITLAMVKKNRSEQMCRNIRLLFNFEPPATDDEIRDAALQFVRKVSGSTRPSKRNEAAFNQAVGAIATAVHELLESLETTHHPRNREEVAAKARAKAAMRYA